MIKNKRSILTYFPRHLKARDIQKYTLLEIEKKWDTADVFVVNLPVASGKSAISITLSRWAGPTSIITPNKLLVNQYNEEYPGLPLLKSKHDYWCSTLDCPVDERPAPKKKSDPKLCPPFMKCDGCSRYLFDLGQARTKKSIISNYYVYMAHKLYRPVLAADEAHQLVPMIKQLASKRFWHHQFRFPTNLDSRDKIRSWVNSLTPERFNFQWKPNGEDRAWAHQQGLQELKDELNSTRPHYLVRLAEDTYRGKEEPVILMEPVDVKGREEANFLWPKHVEKIVLLSATLSRKDIEQLGMGDKRITFIEADSPINAENRPIVIPSNCKPMSYQSQDDNLVFLINYIKELAAYHKDEKGLIHLTYGLAEKLQLALEGTELDKRMIYHDKDNKMEQYQLFRDAPDPVILVASGMYEGIDLPYDSGRWQVLGKVPWPSLAEPAIKYLTSLDPEYYAWETIKTVLQACGRICRTPTDFGVTYIFDKTFKRLYNDNPEFFPKWYKSSVIIEDEEE